MLSNNEQQFINEVVEKLPAFLEKLRSPNKLGFFHYSLSGDYFDDHEHWGLGNAVFFLKLVYMLRLEDRFAGDVQAAFDYSETFARQDGTYSDPIVSRRSRWRRVGHALRHGTTKNIANQETIRAETRQVVATQVLFNRQSKKITSALPTSEREVLLFLKKFDWSKPWNAGSHFSHLVFFLEQSNSPDKDHLIDYAIDWVMQLQKEDGFWYQGNPTISEKINGAMKVISGLRAVKRPVIRKAEKIIDTCLSVMHDEHACDNFNIVLTMRHAAGQVPTYRRSEIEQFFSERLEQYRRYYHPAEGGFSFYVGRANERYYGALLTKGRNEPDIHATTMFVWGIALIQAYLNNSATVVPREMPTV